MQSAARAVDHLLRDDRLFVVRREHDRHAGIVGAAAPPAAPPQAESKVACQLFETSQNDEDERIATVGIEDQADRHPENQSHSVRWSEQRVRTESLLEIGASMAA